MPSGVFAWQDLRRIGVLACGGVLAQLIPARASRFLTHILLSAYRLLLARTVRDLEEKIRKALPADTQPRPHAIVEQHILMRLEDIWGRLRGMRRFGWRPYIEWDGLERLDAPLREGRGIVLWSMRFSSATALKQGFYRRGLPLVHLSRADHGSSTLTTLGLRVAAPLYCRAENCYLAERTQIPLDGSLSYIQKLRERLRGGGLVSIFGEHDGRQNYEAHLLGITMKLALGAPSLAWLENAALFTVAPIRVGPFRYRIVIDEAIPVNRAMPRRKFAEFAAQQYTRRLEARIVQHPADWQGWLYRQF
jgi:lauroyl/myristoyl acyltransferase